MGQISDSPCNVRNKIFQHPSYIYGSMLEFTDSLTCLGFGKQKQTKHQSEFGGTIGGERRPYTGFPCGSADKESTRNVGDLGSIPGLGRSPREGNSYPLQYSGLENSMDFIVHGVTKSRTQLSDLHLRILSLAHHFGFFDLPIKSTSKPPPVVGFHFCRAVGFHDVFPRSTSKIHRSWDFSVRPLVSTNKLHWILLFWSIV